MLAIWPSFGTTTGVTRTLVRAKQIAQDVEPTQAGFHDSPRSFYCRCSPLKLALISRFSSQRDNFCGGRQSFPVQLGANRSSITSRVPCTLNKELGAVTFPIQSPSTRRTLQSVGLG